jgi:hypothetical protein
MFFKCHPERSEGSTTEFLSTKSLRQFEEVFFFGGIIVDLLGQFEIGLAIEAGLEVAAPGSAVKDVVPADVESSRIEVFAIAALENQLDSIRHRPQRLDDVNRVFGIEVALFALAEREKAAVGQPFHLFHEKAQDLGIFEDRAVMPELTLGIEAVVPDSNRLLSVHPMILDQSGDKIQPSWQSAAAKGKAMAQEELREGEDYYFNEDGFMVFTAAYLLKRGYCCENGCRHCPYGFKSDKGPISEDEKV